MDPDYQQLATLLTSRINTISDDDLRQNNPSEQLRQLQAASEAIVVWHQLNRSSIPAQLRHFLQQQSLSKALQFLTDEGLATLPQP